MILWPGVSQPTSGGYFCLRQEKFYKRYTNMYGMQDALHMVKTVFRHKRTQRQQI